MTRDNSLDLEKTRISDKMQFTDKLKVLFVDDSSLCRKYAEIEAEKYAIDLSCVESGQKALQLVKERSFDMLICDYIFPKENGVEIIKSIAEVAKIPKVIILTGINDTSGIRMMLDRYKLDVDAIVRKDRIDLALANIFKGYENAGA